MIIRLAVSVSLAVCAVVFALKLSLPSALVAWAVLMALLCSGGAFLVAHQPIGQSTPLGRVGSCFMRWGLPAGRGQLLPAVAISWLIWTVLGFAAIGLTLVRAEPKSMLMGAVWTVDVLALFYVLGLVLTHFTSGGRNALHLFVIALVLVAMIVISVMTWRSAESDAAQTVSLVLAGGPLVLLGGGYGIMLAMALVSGRRANWH